MARLTVSQYSQAKSMWRSGDFRLKDISERLGVTDAAIHRRFRKDGIKKGTDREIHERALNQAVENTAAAQAEELSRVASEIKDQVIKGCKMLNQRMLYEVARATKEGRPLGDCLQDIKALTEVSRGIQINHKTATDVLGINKDGANNSVDDLPELVVKVMDDDDVRELRLKQEREAELLIGGGRADMDDISGDTEGLIVDDLEIEEEEE